MLVRAGLQPYKDGNQWCILAGNNIQEGICGFGDTIDEALYQFLKEVLDLQQKQKPAEWVLPEDFEEAVYKVANFISPFDNQAELRKTSHRFAEQLLSLAKKELDKPAGWSAEDERMLRLIINAFRNGAMSTIGQEQWLKSLPERFNLQPQAKQAQPEQHPTVKLTGWVARDREYDSYFRLGLMLFMEKKPQRSADNCWNGKIALQLPWESFPDLKWEDEPMEVEVTVKKK